MATAIADARTKIDEAVTRQRDTERNLLELSDALSDVQRESERIVPDEVVGTIRRYRYGNLTNDPLPDGRTTTHRFELEVGQQVWLHIVVGSEHFDKFVEKCGTRVGKGGDSFNDMRIICRRDVSADRFIPVGPQDVIERERQESRALTRWPDDYPIDELPRFGDRSGFVDRNGTELLYGDRVTFDGIEGVFLNVRTGTSINTRRDDRVPGGGDLRFAEGRSFVADANLVVKLT